MSSANDMQNKIEVETPIDMKVEAAVEELSTMANLLRPDIQESVLRSTEALSTDKDFDEGTFQSAIREEVTRHIEVFGRPRATMFICPRVDVRDMSNPSNLYPTSLSIDSIEGRRADIFVSRIPRLFQMFNNLAEKEAPFELVLIIGDSDFAPNVGYQWKAIEFARQKGGRMGAFDEDAFSARTKHYQSYLVELLRTNAVQNDIQLFDVAIDDEPATSPRTIRILSFYELYKSNSVPTSPDSKFNQRALDDESASKLSHYREAVKKYDTEFFGRVSPEEVIIITESKFQSYRDQGLYVLRNIGRLLISDELPSVLKAEMYRNGLLIFWPWIRKESLERNPDATYDKSYKVKLVEPVIES
jgi:hypothetical protein